MPLRVMLVVSNLHGAPLVSIVVVASTVFVISQVESSVAPRSSRTILSPASGPCPSRFSVPWMPASEPLASLPGVAPMISVLGPVPAAMSSVVPAATAGT